MTNRRSRALGANDPRPRTPQDKPKVRYPLVERDGELFIEFSAIGGLATDPARGAYLRVHDPLVVAQGSPYALSIKVDEGFKVTSKGLSYEPSQPEARAIVKTAAANTDDILSSAGDSLTALLQRFQDAYQAADALLDARLDALEAVTSPIWARGTATLSGGTVTVTFAENVPAGAIVIKSHTRFSGGLGFIDHAISADKITFTSSDGSDESDFDYLVLTAP